MLRTLAIIVAIALLGTASHAIIAHADGYGSPHAAITLALAAGVAVGALTIGAAWRQRRRGVACAIGLALICGELFGLISTGERLVAQRDRVQTPVRDAVAQRDAAQMRLADAADALAASGISARLRAAETAKLAADKAAIEKAAEKGCARNCRALLEQQVAEASRELEAARSEIADKQAIARAAVVTARASLEALRVPPSPTPLADRLGLPGWLLDLVVAALGSVAANGLAAALLVFAGHGKGAPHRIPAAVANLAAPVSREAETIEAHPVAMPATLPVANVREHAAMFGVECLQPAPGSFAPLAEVRQIYSHWCEAKGIRALSDAEIGRALAELFSAAGLRIREVDGQLGIDGATVRSRTQLARVA